MVVGKFFIADPRGTTFDLWARQVNQDLSTFITPLSNPTEKDWQAWVRKMYTADSVVAESIPNPDSFSNWRAWAYQWITNMS
jgi:hypothetical protein